MHLPSQTKAKMPQLSRKQGYKLSINSKVQVNAKAYRLNLVTYCITSEKRK
jgi:hypothetical protein